MSDDWTPSTEQVRSHYVFDQSNRWDPERGEAFDCWLAEHDRQVATTAWDEGAAVGHRLYAEPWSHIAIRNPYRSDEKEN